MLYAFPALFAAATAANAPWLPLSVAGAKAYATVGAVVDVGLVAAVAMGVLPRLRAADPETLARRGRRLTVALTGVVAYLLVAWVAPEVVGLARPTPTGSTGPTDLPLPGDGVVTLPSLAPVAGVVAATVVLVGAFALRRYGGEL